MNGEPHGTFTGGYSKGSESMESGLGNHDQDGVWPGGQAKMRKNYADL